MNAIRYKHTIYLLMCAILILTAARVYADLFDQASQEFTFNYTINGYEQNTWFLHPAAVALDDRAGLLYVADTKTGIVDAFTFQGIPKFQYGRKNELKAPVGLAVDKDGNLYISEDEGGPIKAINTKGETSNIEVTAIQGDQPVKPGRMAVDRDGNLYVTDRANNRIYVLDKDHKLKFTIGGTGNKRGQFKALQDVAIDRQGRIYAVDGTGTPVQVFDKKGKYIYKIGFSGDGEQDLSFPAGVFIDQNDQVWVVDRGQNSLKVFSRSGDFLRRFGRYGIGESSMYYPIDAAIDSLGRVFVLQAQERGLQVFTLNRPYENFKPRGL